MHFLTLLFFAALAFTGCKRNEEAHVRRVVDSVGATKLLSDAATLALQPDAKAGFPEPASSLPPSFYAFAPIETWRYDDSFLIVTARHFQHRVGVLAQPLRYPEPQAGGNDRYVKIAPGIYYYES